MTRTIIAWATLVIVIGFALAALPLLSQSNPPCPGVSATAYVNWAQLGFDACHTGFNPNELILGPSNVGALALAWTHQTGGDVISTLAVANGMLYAASLDEYLYALNAKTGALLWKFQMSGADYPTPVVVNGVVYVAGGSYLYALRATDGKLLWKYTANYYAYLPTVVDGVVYFGANDGLYAVKADTGTLIWKSGDNVWMGYTAVANGIVYVTASQVGQLYAFDASTGALLWISDKYHGNSPVVTNGIVYLGTEGSPYGPGVIALKADTGAFLWNFQTQDAIFNSPAVAYGTVYLQAGYNSYDNYLYALDAQTGELKWSFYNAPSTYISPVVANGVVYTFSFAWGSSDGLQAVDALTGQLLWQDESLFGSAIVANGWMYVTNDDPTVYAFHLPGR